MKYHLILVAAGAKSEISEMNSLKEFKKYVNSNDILRVEGLGKKKIRLLREAIR